MVLNERRWDPRQFSKIDIFAGKCRVKAQRPLPLEFVSKYVSVYGAQDEDAIGLCFIIDSVLTCRNRQSSDQLDKIYSVLGPAQRIFPTTNVFINIQYQYEVVLTSILSRSSILNILPSFHTKIRYEPCVPKLIPLLLSPLPPSPTTPTFFPTYFFAYILYL